MNRLVSSRGGWSWWYLLLLIQFIAVLWPPFYNRVEPSWIGMPFFYWYQLLWIIIGAILTAMLHRLLRYSQNVYTRFHATSILPAPPPPTAVGLL